MFLPHQDLSKLICFSLATPFHWDSVSHWQHLFTWILFLMATPFHRDSVSHWRGVVAAVVPLHNPDLRERHWAKIDEVLHVRLQRDISSTLEDLIGMNVSRHRAWVRRLSADSWFQELSQGCSDQVHVAAAG